MVPFHVSVIKNIVVQREGRIDMMRINFNTPVNYSKLLNEFPKDLNKAVYIQELTFKSADGSRYEEIVKDYKKMAKDYTPFAHLNQKMISDLEIVDGRKPILQDILIRPSFTGKRCPGRIELHRNGFRIKSLKDERIDILLEDIEKAFYHPPDESDMYIIHFYLKKEVLIDKRMVKNVQVYALVGVLTSELEEQSTNKRRKGKKLSEAEEEALFDQRRESLERTFDGFLTAVETQVTDKLEFETPDFDLTVTGAFNFTSTEMYFTESCFVCLTSYPFLVVPLDEVEVVAFERAGFMNRTFDMVFIFKDYSRSVVNVNGIASSLKQQIKVALDSRNVIVLEGTTNLKWTAVLKRVCSDLENFIEVDGGWKFFAGDTERNSKGEEDGGEQDELSNDTYSEEWSGEGDEDASSDEYSDDNDSNSGKKPKNNDDDESEYSFSEEESDHSPDKHSSFEADSDDSMFEKPKDKKQFRK